MEVTTTHAPISPLLPKVDGVIFDCDGVLVDSERITSRVWAGLLTEIGLPTTTEQSLATYMGNSMATCMAMVAERLGRTPPDDLLPRFHRESRSALGAEVQPVDGIIALLDALDAAGVPYAVGSNGEQGKMEVTLNATGLAPRFAGRRFSSIDIGRPKPAPDVFLHAAHALGVDPARTVVVEDSAIGIAAACAAGMTAIGFAELVPAERLVTAGARATVMHLRDIPALLGIASTSQ